MRLLAYYSRHSVGWLKLKPPPYECWLSIIDKVSIPAKIPNGTELRPVRIYPKSLRYCIVTSYGLMSVLCEIVHVDYREETTTGPSLDRLFYRR